MSLSFYTRAAHRELHSFPTRRSSDLTKAFSTMIVAVYLLGLWLGRQRDAITAEDVRKRIRDLVEIPRLVEQTLELDAKVAALARHLSHATDFLYLGRGVQYPIALEGALKLKEISYIH